MRAVFIPAGVGFVLPFPHWEHTRKFRIEAPPPYNREASNRLVSILALFAMLLRLLPSNCSLSPLPHARH
jgi:hypothetical protein